MTYIPLDTVHPVAVTPVEDETITVKVLGGAARSKEDPTVTSTSGTERAENAEVIIEPNQIVYFITKKVAEGEVQKPVVLEVKQPMAGGVDSADIQTGAVTEPKLGAEAVASSKTLRATVPVATGVESLTAQVGTAGVPKSVVTLYNAKKEASAKVKIKHGLGTEYPVVTAWKASAGKATEKIADGAAVAGAISKVKMTSANEVELTLVATEPAEKEELVYIVTAP